MLVLVEVPALLLISWASPMLSTWVSAVLGIVGAYLSQTQRSIAARRSEKAAKLGIESVRVSCEAADERRAIWQQRLGTLSPFIGVAAAYGTTGINRAVIVGCLCTIARNLWVGGYGAWRASYLATQSEMENDHER